MMTSDLVEVAQLLDRGGVVAVPTESSYGLAADPLSAPGVATIFEIKRRPGGEPLPVTFAAFGQLERLGIAADAPGLRLLEAIGPAPLSVVVDCATGLPAAAGGDTLAVRRPDHRGLLDLLTGLDRPLTATSANRSGSPPILDPTRLEPLLRGFDATVWDGGLLPGGAPSTLVRATAAGTLTVLREGRFPSSRARALWRRLSTQKNQSASSP